VPIEHITVLHGDTVEVRSGGLTVGSRSVQMGGSAIAVATDELIEQARKRAAGLLEAAVDDVVLDVSSGRFHVVGTPARDVGWADLAAAEEGPLAADTDFAADGGTFPFGAHVAVVEVDTETGDARLIRHIAVDDAGTLINPLLAEGQVHGGVATGVAQALWEDFRYDEEGTPLSSTLVSYGFPSAAELPSWETVEMETPSPNNPLGAKGIGESGTIGSTPAVHSAVLDALAPYGVKHVDLPCNGENVWRAIQEAKS
jgi:carbon-monoxide dehydrogenase large subunit